MRIHHKELSVRLPHRHMQERGRDIKFRESQAIANVVECMPEVFQRVIITFYVSVDPHFEITTDSHLPSLSSRHDDNRMRPIAHLKFLDHTVFLQMVKLTIRHLDE